MGWMRMRGWRPSSAMASVAVALGLAGVLIGAYAWKNRAPQIEVAQDPHYFDHERSKTTGEIKQRFEQAVVMLHAKRYDMALAALDRLLELAPNMPEAHVNAGYALIGMSRFEEAKAAFDRALELQPRQANAYYGLGVVFDALHDDEAAIGHMRTFLHLTDANHPYRRQAQALIWEAEGKLGRYRPEHLDDEFRVLSPATPASKP